MDTTCTPIPYIRPYFSFNPMLMYPYLRVYYLDIDNVIYS